MRLEIVTHSWKYSRLLTFQLSSFALHPPKRLDVRVTVFYAKEDELVRPVLEFFATHSIPRVEWNWIPLPPRKLFRRGIGRNQAALATTADWVWFADADYCFGEKCLDSLPALLESTPGPLAFPRWVLTNKTHQLGDVAIESLADGPRIAAISPADFSGRRMNRATGGIQIARGESCRKVGYCNGSRRHLRPAKKWARTFEDVYFRRVLGTRGRPINLPNIYRLRHSSCGRVNTAVNL